ncbi:hypothetical protein EOD42_22625 [Rhodovarius crocodyli]|uniref:Putative phage metallopeptidase domain-containing protein n=1 Tax=Rhodovarius crocodyli TaxID=1979269 RepID=A0A437M1Q7_9PROT|nr:putative metallopeptidase [Rhodovarius crocodyli]RVT91454.1 hypothetical protein EOD42_22625 [Rhodovarius crocodyli]
MTFAPAPEGPNDPRPIMERLIECAEDFDTLRIAKPDILVLMRHVPKLRGGKRELGSMGLPGFQGAYAQLGMWLLEEFHGSIPAFILTLDAEFWEEASERQREALIFHELMHCMQALDKDGEPRFDAEGLPVWAIRPHDIEEFNEVVRRYGAWLPDVKAFISAATERRNDR